MKELYISGIFCPVNGYEANGISSDKTTLAQILVPPIQYGQAVSVYTCPRTSRDDTRTRSYLSIAQRRLPSKAK